MGCTFSDAPLEEPEKRASMIEKRPSIHTNEDERISRIKSLLLKQATTEIELDEKTQDVVFLGKAKEGVKFTKIGFNSGKPKVKTVKIIWKKEDNKDEIGTRLDYETGHILLKDIKDVFKGKKTDVFSKIKPENAKSSECLSVISKDRTLDLVADSTSIRDEWCRGLCRLLSLTSDNDQIQKNRIEERYQQKLKEEKLDGKNEEKKTLVDNTSKWGYEFDEAFRKE